MLTKMMEIRWGLGGGHSQTHHAPHGQAHIGQGAFQLPPRALSYKPQTPPLLREDPGRPLGNRSERSMQALGQGASLTGSQFAYQQNGDKNASLWE